MPLRARPFAPTARHPSVVPLLELLRSALPADLGDATAEQVLAVALALDGLAAPPPRGPELRRFLEVSLRRALRTSIGDADGARVLARVRDAAMPPRVVLAASVDPDLVDLLRASMYVDDVLVVVRDGGSLCAWARAMRSQSPVVVIDLRDAHGLFAPALDDALGALEGGTALLWGIDSPHPAPTRASVHPLSSAPAAEVAQEAIAAADD